MRRRTAIMISGRGSNMSALLAAARSPDFPAEIVMVLSNVREAPGLAIATRYGVVAQAVDHRPYRGDRAAHEAALATMLDGSGVEIVCLAGYMRLLTPFLVKRYKGRMLNIHPSLLPAFPGLHTHERALAAGVKLHGATVHLVTEKTDEGPILAQAAVPVLPGDDAAALGARVLTQEHLIYPLALRLLAQGLSATATAPAEAQVTPVIPDASLFLRNPLGFSVASTLPSEPPVP